jgi:hypothetical protein
MTSPHRLALVAPERAGYHPRKVNEGRRSFGSALKVLMSAHSPQPAMPVVRDPAVRQSGSRLEQLVFNNRLLVLLLCFVTVLGLLRPEPASQL